MNLEAARQRYVAPTASEKAEDEEDKEEERWMSNLPGRFLHGLERFFKALIVGYRWALVVVSLCAILGILFYLADFLGIAFYAGDKAFVATAKFGEDTLNDLVGVVNDVISPASDGILFVACQDLLEGMDDVCNAVDISSCPPPSDCNAMPTVPQITWTSSPAFKNAQTLLTCELTDSMNGEILFPLRAEGNNAICGLYRDPASSNFQYNMGLVLSQAMSIDGCVAVLAFSALEWGCMLINIKYFFVMLMFVLPSIILYILLVTVGGIFLHFFGGIGNGLRTCLAREPVTKKDKERNESEADIEIRQEQRKARELASLRPSAGTNAGKPPGTTAISSARVVRPPESNRPAAVVSKGYSREPREATAIPFAYPTPEHPSL